MNDLISRQAAIKALHDEIVRKRISEDANDCGALDEFDTEAILRRLPSEEPEIIRCKDCKDFRRWIDTDTTFCDLTDGIVCEDDFCSRAERRTDEQSN